MNTKNGGFLPLLPRTDGETPIDADRDESMTEISQADRREHETQILPQEPHCVQ